MKLLITENKLHNYIERYILEGYPDVKNVTFTTKDVYLASGDKSERRTIQRTIIVLGFISGQMSISPTSQLRHVREDINRMFGLGIGESGSDWGIDWKITNLTGKKDT
jgi:hypothetical protein